MPKEARKRSSRPAGTATEGVCEERRGRRDDGPCCLIGAQAAVATARSEDPETRAAPVEGELRTATAKPTPPSRARRGPKRADAASRGSRPPSVGQGRRGQAWPTGRRGWMRRGRPQKSPRPRASRPGTRRGPRAACAALRGAAQTAHRCGRGGAAAAQGAEDQVKAGRAGPGRREAGGGRGFGGCAGRRRAAERFG